MQERIAKFVNPADDFTVVLQDFLESFGILASNHSFGLSEVFHGGLEDEEEGLACCVACLSWNDCAACILAEMRECQTE